MNKAIFLDRDGVINIELGDYVLDEKNFLLVENLAQNLKLLKEHNYLLIVISNQGGIAKKLFTKEHVESLHQKIQEELKKSGVEIDEFYFCPHYPGISNCICRKPDTLMLEKAIARFNIDPSQSYFIGDRETDYMAGNKVGLNSIKVNSNQNLTGIIDQLIN
ncbi:D-glycero-alpha-D-manno-heptose-1,7-bisphosphate 7-phosphatase [Bacteroidota bacterium]